MTDPLPPVHEDDPYYLEPPEDDPLSDLSAYEFWYFNGDVDEEYPR